MSFVSSYQPGVRRQIYTQIGIIIAAGILFTCICIDLSFAKPRSSECSNGSYIKNSEDWAEDDTFRRNAFIIRLRRCWSRCNDVCYNPFVHACVDNRLNCSCSASCDNECYNPERWDCVDNKLCPVGQNICHLNSIRSECVARDTCICPSKNDSEGKTFCRKQTPEENICQNARGLYCGKVCYNNSADIDVVCAEDGRALCRNGSLYCNNECYSPESKGKCHEGFTWCQAGEEYCNGRCYVPKSGAISMCGSKCYDPNYGEICLDGLVCRSAEARCGNSCYDPKSEECLKNNLGEIPCRHGMQLCGRFCMCPHNETCLNENSISGPRACPNTEKICGDTCYNPDTIDGRCVNDVICKKNEVGCNGLCIDTLKASKHAGCFNTRGWKVWYVNNMRLEQLPKGGAVSDSVKFECLLEENFNGDCQPGTKWKGKLASSNDEVDEGEDHD